MGARVDRRLESVATPGRALVERVAWLRLRGILREECAPFDGPSQRAILSAFDRLPFTNKSPLLPSEDELWCTAAADSSLRVQLQRASAEPVIHRLVDAVARSREWLSTVNIADGTVRVSNAGPGLQRVAWHSPAAAVDRSSFTISSARAQWLRDTHQGESCAFDDDLFRMLARYDAVSGTAAAGAQAAVPDAVYSAFEHAAGGEALEAYASPLNHRMRPTPSQPPRFGTAFADTDVPFGGVGRFDTCAARLLTDGGGDGGGGGVTQPHQLLLVNPPFGPRDMLSMAAALEQQLAARRDGALTAVVVVPTLSARAMGGEAAPHAAPHMAALEALPSAVASVRLAAGQHRYVHGLAHRRTRVRSVLRPSAHETAVLVLSTHPQRARIGAAVVDAVKAAFESIR